MDVDSGEIQFYRFSCVRVKNTVLRKYNTVPVTSGIKGFEVKALYGVQVDAPVY